MEINGKTVFLQGKSFSEIGEMLRDASQSKTGAGLKVVLTRREEYVFARDFGMAVGMALCDMIAKAIREAGGKPNGFKYTYSDFVFETTAI